MEEGSVSEAILNKIMKILEGNPYAQFFKRLQDITSIEDVRLHISKDVNLYQRVYNCPTSDQVAAIWIDGNNSNVLIERDIVIHSHLGYNHKVKHYYGCYDPLQYPLLFPLGEVGWHQNIPKINSEVTTVTTTLKDISYQENEGVDEYTNDSRTNTQISAHQLLNEEELGFVENPKNVSCREYYSYKFQIRSSRKSTLLHAGRLFQQYAVDQYIKLETTRLDIYRRKQGQMRAELYQRNVESVVNGEARASKVGLRIVLPSSFIGGDRDTRRRFLDSMALVQRFGKPDLFITMTCNPEWKEIQKQLLPGQLPQYRPDLTTRIFRAKLQDLKDQLFKKKYLEK